MGTAWGTVERRQQGAAWFFDEYHWYSLGTGIPTPNFVRKELGEAVVLQMRGLFEDVESDLRERELLPTDYQPAKPMTWCGCQTRCGRVREHDSNGARSWGVSIHSIERPKCPVDVPKRTFVKMKTNTLLMHPEDVKKGRRQAYRFSPRVAALALRLLQRRGMTAAAVPISAMRVRPPAQNSVPNPAQATDAAAR